MPFEVKHYQREPEGMAPQELVAVHPLGTAPVITDGDVTVAESGAIVGESALSIYAAWDVFLAEQINRDSLYHR